MRMREVIMSMNSDNVSEASVSRGNDCGRERERDEGGSVRERERETEKERLCVSMREIVRENERERED